MVAGIKTVPISIKDVRAQMMKAAGSQQTQFASAAAGQPTQVKIAPALRNIGKQDPALKTQGMPPNYGEYVLPHVMTLQGLVSNISKCYRISDEALEDSFDNARFMENDIGIWECIDARIRSGILLDWHLQPDDENNPEQIACVEKLTKILKATPRLMQLREQLMLAIWYGRSGVSLKYGWDYCGSPEMAIKIAQWKPIHGDKLLFRFDDGSNDHDPDQVGIRVGLRYSKGQRVNDRWEVETTDRGLAYFLSTAERSLIAVHKHQIQDSAFERPQDAGRIHGVGIRSKIYWEWFMKQNTLQWLMEYIERSAFGLELWFYPMGNDKARNDAETAIKNRSGPFKNVVLVPVPPDDGSGNQYGVEHVETGGAAIEALLNILEKYFGHRIKRLVLGQTLTSEAEATGLGGNLADIHLLTFRDIVKYDANNIDETMTTDIVKPLKQFNCPNTKHFNVRFVTETEPVDADAKLSAYEKAWNMFVRIREADVLKAIGASAPKPSDRVLPPPGGAGGAAEAPGAPANEKSDMAEDMDEAMRNHPDSARAMGADYDSAVEKNANAKAAEKENPFDKAKYGDNDLRFAIDAAAALTECNPTDAQKEAGNYKKGRFNLHGLEISIENPRGSIRRGKDWAQEMPHHYGYIRKTESGADGDRVDVFVGPDPESETVFIVDQTKADGTFDEHKCMIGFKNAADAAKAYVESHSGDWKGFNGMIPLSIPAFKKWLDDGDSAAPIWGQDIAKYAAEFQESLHPRNENGEFAKTLNKMISIEPRAMKGALVSAGDLRKAHDMPKEDFDRHILNMSKAGLVSLHRHDFVGSLSDAERDDLIHAPTDDAEAGSGGHKGKFFAGLSIRRD